MQDAGCQASPETPPNDVVCMTGSDTKESNTSAKVFFVQVGHDQTLLKTTYSNGEVQYTLTDKDSAQAIADLFQVEAEAGSVGLDVQAQASAGGELDGAHVWTFPDQSAANAFDQQVSSAGGWGQVAHDLPGGIPGAGSVLSFLGIDGSPDPNGLDTQQLAYSYTGASAGGQGGAETVVSWVPPADRSANVEVSYGTATAMGGSAARLADQVRSDNALLSAAERASSVRVSTVTVAGAAQARLVTLRGSGRAGPHDGQNCSCRPVVGP
jgi:hypothetical protein